jgi:hypothetical protein
MIGAAMTRIEAVEPKINAMPTTCAERAQAMAAKAELVVIDYLNLQVHHSDNEVAELKKRGNGFKQLYEWIQESRYLIVAADRSEPLMVMRLKDWIAGETR